MTDFLPVEEDEDFATWERFRDNPEVRWLFNKLEVALRQGLEAGPAGCAPRYEGFYIHRPVYNLFGMGIGASKFVYQSQMEEDFLNNAVVPPGSFWCEWLEGPHLSIDFQKDSQGDWHTVSAWEGFHSSDKNLTRFSHWERLTETDVPTIHRCSRYINLVDLPVNGINIETREGFITEIHLRHGNDPFETLPVGTRIMPIWQDMDIPEGGVFMPNLHEDLEKYSAYGHLSDVRRGFVIETP